MLKKTITYTDYNGEERTEDFYFNLTKAEIVEMQMGTHGGFDELLKTIIKTKDQPSLIKIFKEIILKAYGEKSADGKRFMKIDENGKSLSINFSQTEAYSNLFMELATNDGEAAKFINGIVPKEAAEEAQKRLAEDKELSSLIK